MFCDLVDWTCNLILITSKGEIANLVIVIRNEYRRRNRSKKLLYLVVIPAIPPHIAVSLAFNLQEVIWEGINKGKKERKKKKKRVFYCPSGGFFFFPL